MSEWDMDQLLDEITELSEVPILNLSCEFTISDYKAKVPMSREGISHRLSKLVDKGVLATGIRFDPRRNRQVRAWWKIVT